MMVSFFNDVDVASREAWVAAVQYFGTQGFFAGYDARPRDPLGRRTAAIWLRAALRVRAGDYDPMRTVRELHEAVAGRRRTDHARRPARGAGPDLAGGLAGSGSRDARIGHPRRLLPAAVRADRSRRRLRLTSMTHDTGPGRHSEADYLAAGERRAVRNWATAGRCDSAPMATCTRKSSAPTASADSTCSKG